MTSYSKYNNACKKLLAALMPLLWVAAIAQQPSQDSVGISKFEYLFPPKKELKAPKTDTGISLYEFYDMSLEELNNVKATGVPPELEQFINDLISVSTEKAVSTKNNPNIVSVITAEEIANAGYRDLLDVLNMVPGFHFALDRDGRVGLGIRGNWANEGKVLLMVNGMEMNDIYASNLYFGNEFPVDLIERIEIIRGPGSAIYGGFAEFGVINIITKDVNTLSGLSVNGTFGRMDHSVGRFTQSLYIGNKWKKASFSMLSYNGIGQRSDRNNYAFYYDKIHDRTKIGDFATLNGNSDLNPKFSQMNISFKNLTFTTTTSFYDVTNVDVLDENKNRPERWGATINNTQFKYEKHFSPKFTLTPSINIINSFPFSEEIQDSIKKGNKKELEGNIARLKGKIFADYELSHRISLTGGTDVYSDYAKAQTNTKFYVGDKNIQYTNTGIYAQGLFRLPAFNITAGARFDNHSEFGSSFVPRIGFTKSFEKIHVKLLFSEAYRTPTIGNYAKSIDVSNPQYVFDTTGTTITSINHKIKPEKTDVYEAEIGYRPCDKMMFTFNVYTIRTKDPIVQYYHQDDFLQTYTGYEEAGLWVYKNYSSSGSSGAEIDLRYKDKWGYFDINYSFYTVEHLPRVPVYGIRTFSWNEEERREVVDNALLSFPKHKINLNICYKLAEDLSADLSLNYFGKRYGYDVLIRDVDIDGVTVAYPSGVLKKTQPQLIANAFFRYNNLFTPGLHLGMGIFNIFNTKYDFTQPYFGRNVPLPGPTRELLFKLSYNLKFKK